MLHAGIKFIRGKGQKPPFNDMVSRNQDNQRLTCVTDVHKLI